MATRTPAAGEEKVQTATPPCQATRKGDGLGMLQLDRERRPGFLEKGKMMNGIRYRRLLTEKLEFFMKQRGTSHFL